MYMGAVYSQSFTHHHAYFYLVDLKAKYIYVTCHFTSFAITPLIACLASQGQHTCVSMH